MGLDGFDVFLSYARGDVVAAAELDGWLRAHSLRTFFDRSELRAGLRWIPALEEAIDRSNAVAILVGPHGLGNTQQYERELALVRQTRDNSFPVIPVLMPGCENPPTGFLQLLTWIDLSRADSVLRQMDSLEALRGAIHRQEVAPSSIRTRICPYRGLEPFREEERLGLCHRRQPDRLAAPRAGRQCAGASFQGAFWRHGRQGAASSGYGHLRASCESPRPPHRLDIQRR
jgi:TIR domain